MSKVSKRVLNKDLEKHIFEVFTKTLASLKTQEEVKNFVEDLLSPSEKTMLVKRLAIAIMLGKGYTWDAIDSILKVSRPTIMNVSYWLKNGSLGYQKAVKMIVDSQKREELFDKIEEVFLSMSPPKAYGSVGFERKSKAGKKLFQRKIKRSLL